MSIDGPPKNHLALFRRQMGLSAYALAGRIGVAPQTISRIESGVIAKPRILTKRAIAEELGVTVEEVFPGGD